MLPLLFGLSCCFLFVLSFMQSKVARLDILLLFCITSFSFSLTSLLDFCATHILAGVFVHPCMHTRVTLGTTQGLGLVRDVAPAQFIPSGVIFHVG